jgi:hypothetical protein
MKTHTEGHHNLSKNTLYTLVPLKFPPTRSRSWLPTQAEEEFEKIKMENRDARWLSQDLRHDCDRHR